MCRCQLSLTFKLLVIFFYTVVGRGKKTYPWDPKPKGMILEEDAHFLTTEQWRGHSVYLSAVLIYFSIRACALLIRIDEIIKHGVRDDCV
jgi:hypothetical protein